MDTFKLWCVFLIHLGRVPDRANAVSSYCYENDLNCNPMFIISAPCTDPFFTMLGDAIEKRCQPTCQSSFLASRESELFWHALFSVIEFPVAPFRIYYQYTVRLTEEAAEILNDPDSRAGCADGLQAAIRLLSLDPRMQRYFWQSDGEVLVMYDGPVQFPLRPPPMFHTFVMPDFASPLAFPFSLSRIESARFHQAPERFRDEECFEKAYDPSSAVRNTVSTMEYEAENIIRFVRNGLARQGISVWILRGAKEEVWSMEPPFSTGWLCNSNTERYHSTRVPVLAISVNDVNALVSLQDNSDNMFVMEVDAYRHYEVGLHPWPELASTGVSLSSMCSSIHCQFAQVVVFGFVHKMWPTLPSSVPQTLAVFLAPIQPCAVPVAELDQPTRWFLPGTATTTN